jgi:hypothetical protein
MILCRVGIINCGFDNYIAWLLYIAHDDADKNGMITIIIQPP